MNWHYPKRGPKKAAGGIRLEDTFGVSKTFWGKRWIETLESFGWKTRIEKGLTYAKAGQVLSIRVDQGFATAEVHGSRLRPYKVEIGFPMFSSQQWKRVADALEKRAFHTAKLLSGEMPVEMEAVFLGARASLLPDSETDITSDCTCPGGERLCKHVAAAFYILGQEFDRNPFLIFDMRGFSREKLLAEVQARRKAPTRRKAVPASAPVEAPSTTNLSKSLSEFFKAPVDRALGWKPGPDFLERLPKPGARIKEMGVPPFWESDNSFDEVLTRIYQMVRTRQLEMK